MSKKGRNSTLHTAKVNKNDEFYTLLTTIEEEIKHYKNHFKDKIVFCNCDDPEWSNFFKYFDINFNHLGLKKLIATHYDTEEKTYVLIKERNSDGSESETKYIKLKQNGDFRSPESVEFLKEADIVVTNPPFSLFREYVKQLIECGKKFLIIGNQNAITYKEIFPLLKENKIWLGYENGAKIYRVPDDFDKKNVFEKDGVKYAKFGNTCWFTNLDIKKRHEDLVLYKSFNQDEYPMYDNYCAWNVDKVADIPVDDEIEVTVDGETYKRLKATYGDDCVLVEEIDE